MLARSVLVLGLLLLMSFTTNAQTHDAATMRATHARMKDALANSPLQGPIHLESGETASGLQGDVFAEVPHSVASIEHALSSPSQWCDAMVPHINTKKCRASGDAHRGELNLSIVRKWDQDADQAFVLTFAYRVITQSADYLEVQLTSGAGPLGTSNYRILLQVVALPDGRSFLHFSYAYDSNALARTASQLYLATFGSAKVGFTVLSREPDGSPTLIRGMRGLVERNAMRFFVAIEAHLDALAAPAPEQFEKRLDLWFSGSERYPRQLHEIDRATYLNLKRADQRRNGPGT